MIGMSPSIADPAKVRAASIIGTVGDLVEDIAVRLTGPVHLASDTEAVIDRRRGGSAANMAVSVARHGRPARFIGQVGDDMSATLLVAALEGDGVEVIVRRSGRTGAIVVLLDAAGERTMLTDRGACADLADPEPTWLDGLGVLHVPAYSLTGGALAQTSATLIEWAHQRRIVVSIDLSSEALIESVGVAEMTALVGRLAPDVLLANELEAACFGDVGALAALGAAVTVVKQGAGPAMVSVAGARPIAIEARTIAEVRDTTGAGDAFAAGLLSALLDGVPALQAAEAGHRTAAEVIARLSRPTP